MATDGDVVGRIREAHFRLIGPEHAGIALGLQGFAAKNAMLATMPEITQTGHGRGSIVDRWQLVFLVDAVTIQQGIEVLRAMIILRPETVVRGHRAGLRRYWRWKSGCVGGRPQIAAELRALIW